MRTIATSNSNVKEKALVWVILALGAASPIFLAVVETKLWAEPRFAFGNCLIFAGSLVPYLLLGFAVNWMKSLPIKLTSLFAAIMSGYSFYVYYYTYALHPDADAGMLFFIIPVYQFIAAPIFLLLAFIVNFFIVQK